MRRMSDVNKQILLLQVNFPGIYRLWSAVCQVSKHVLLRLDYVKFVAHIQHR